MKLVISAMAAAMLVAGPAEAAFSYRYVYWASPTDAVTIAEPVDWRTTIIGSGPHSDFDGGSVNNAVTFTLANTSDIDILFAVPPENFGGTLDGDPLTFTRDENFNWTASFADIEAGAHTVTFTGVEDDLYITNIRVTPLPAPALLLGAALAGGLAWRRIRS